MEKNIKDDYDFGNAILPKFFIIADLNGVPVKTGFPWG